MGVNEEMQASDEARTRLKQAMLRLRQGDQTALEEIYQATSAKLFGICLRILGDEREAEDAVQEVYVSLWRKADRYDPDRGSPISWLAMFARNRAIDRLRSGKVRQGAVSVDEAAEVPDAAPLADALVEQGQQSERVHHCIGTLDERASNAIRSAFFWGATYAELAARADVPLSTMKSWIRRGLARLKTCLEAE